MFRVEECNYNFVHTYMTAYVQVSAGPPSKEQVTSAGALSISTQMTSRDVGLSLVVVQFRTNIIEREKF